MLIVENSVYHKVKHLEMLQAPQHEHILIMKSVENTVVNSWEDKFF